MPTRPRRRYTIFFAWRTARPPLAGQPRPRPRLLRRPRHRLLRRSRWPIATQSSAVRFADTRRAATADQVPPGWHPSHVARPRPGCEPCFTAAGLLVPAGARWPRLMIGAFAPSAVAVLLTAREEGEGGSKGAAFPLGGMACRRAMVCLRWIVRLGAVDSVSRPTLANTSTR